MLSFVGFDISSEQFTMDSNLSSTSSSIRFVEHNVFERFTEMYHNHFDLVHVRLLVGAMTVSKISTVLQNVTEILRSGGWLQWHDLSNADVTAVPPHPVAMEMDRAIFDLVHKMDGSFDLPTEIVRVILNMNTSLSTFPTDLEQDEDQAQPHLLLSVFERTTIADCPAPVRHSAHVSICQAFEGIFRETAEALEAALKDDIMSIQE